jgi:hypothetical protein
MNNIEKLIAPMINCEQTKGQSVYQHGLSVCSYLKELKRILESDNDSGKWRIPT